MFDFAGNTVNIGPIPIDVDVDAHVSFESLLKFSGTFNPATFAASQAVGLFASLFNGAKERALLRQQIDLLKDIRGQLDKLNETAKEILEKLDALPKTFRDELLNQHHEAIEAAIDQFAANPKYRLYPQELRQLQAKFHALAYGETRISKIGNFVRYVEFLNFIDKGDSQKFLRDCLNSRIKFLHGLMDELVKKFATLYFGLTSELASNYVNFTGRPFEVDNLPGAGEGTYVHDLHPARAKLRVGEGPKQFDDVVLDYTPYTYGEVKEQFSRTKITYNSKPEFIYDMQAMSGKCNEDGGWGNCAIYAAVMIGGVNEYWRREQVMKSSYEKFKEAVPVIREDIASFAELQKLKQALEQCVEFDYAEALRHAHDHLKH